VTLFPPVNDDDRWCVIVPVLRQGEDTKTYLPYVNDLYLKYLFAETKILAGLGERAVGVAIAARPVQAAKVASISISSLRTKTTSAAATRVSRSRCEER
jgi:hypothetical protein